MMFGGQKWSLLEIDPDCLIEKPRLHELAASTGVFFGVALEAEKPRRIALVDSDLEVSG
jgi:hypothetical protein